MLREATGSNGKDGSGTNRTPAGPNEAVERTPGEGTHGEPREASGEPQEAAKITTLTIE